MSVQPKYPDEFIQRMQNLLHEDYPAFIGSLDEPSPTSIRLNPNKKISKFDNDEQVAWCSDGRYLKERPSFTFDPLFQAGTYYVQEASSMFIEEVWKHINPGNQTVRVLDLCAAPGGKSTHLLSLMNEESLLVTNEIIPNRNKILRQNIIKWGNANCIITQNKPEDFSPIQNYFDIVLVDAPCSGEGLFRKDKDAIDEWSERNVAMCSVRQKEILQHAIECLKPGGFLIYSTCTYEPVENDENMEQSSVFSLQFSVEEKYPSLQKTKFGYQFFPHKIKGEGFYIAVAQKHGDSFPAANPKQQTPDSKPQTAPYLEHPENFTEQTINDLIFAIPKSIASEFSFLEKQLYVRNAGILMGAMKGKDFLPSHDLALSNHIKKDLPFIEMNYDDAITYLRGESPKVQTDIRGWCLIKYEGFNLGWAKMLEGRMNNYFPKDWRILKR